MTPLLMSWLNSHAGSTLAAQLNAWSIQHLHSTDHVTSTRHTPHLTAPAHLTSTVSCVALQKFCSCCPCSNSTCFGCQGSSCLCNGGKATAGGKQCCCSFGCKYLWCINCCYQALPVPVVKAAVSMAAFLGLMSRHVGSESKHFAPLLMIALVLMLTSIFVVVARRVRRAPMVSMTEPLVDVEDPAILNEHDCKEGSDSSTCCSHDDQ